MTTVAYLLIAIPAVLLLYAYAGYPLLLKLIGCFVHRPAAPAGGEWPTVSITVPAFNEEFQIRETLESLLALDYPAERRQILVVSDASTDGTDEIVREYADRGVELFRVPYRMGKTAAENLARPHLTGDIVVNTDASIRIPSGSLQPLVAAFADPTVGLASGRDVSVARRAEDANAGESGYVGYEMWVRALETRVHGIVGASGCFYAIRAPLHHANEMPDGLSRDFAAALVTHEHGYRAVSVDAAICYVPRTLSLRREYHRKVRTMARGLQTLFYKRHLLNPLAHGVFAWMLFSHKLARWLVPPGLVVAAIAVLLLAVAQPWGVWLAVAGVATIALAGIGWVWPAERPLPRPVAVPTYALAGIAAALHAWAKALRGERPAVWEPTRREAVV